MKKEELEKTMLELNTTFEVKEEKNDKNLEFKKPSDKEFEELKKTNSELGFFEFFVPDFGYLYFRNLNLEELNEIYSMFITAKGMPKQENAMMLLGRLIEETIIRPAEPLAIQKIKTKFVIKKPKLAELLSGAFMAEANKGTEGVTFRGF